MPANQPTGIGIESVTFGRRQHGAVRDTYAEHMRVLTVKMVMCALITSDVKTGRDFSLFLKSPYIHSSISQHLLLEYWNTVR